MRRPLAGLARLTGGTPRVVFDFVVPGDRIVAIDLLTGPATLDSWTFDACDLTAALEQTGVTPASPAALSTGSGRLPELTDGRPEEDRARSPLGTGRAVMTELSGPRPVVHRAPVRSPRGTGPTQGRRSGAVQDAARPAVRAVEAEVGEELLDLCLTAAQAGDQTAFAELYRDTQPRLLRYAASIVGQDADDVTGEAWLQIARDLHRFDGDVMGFRGWTATIVRNRAFDHLRAAQRRPTIPLEEFFLDRPSELDTAVSATDNLSTAAALRMIAGLPADQAEAVLLRTVVGLDASTAGEILGKRAGAVRVAAHRGLKALGRLLDEQRSRRLEPPTEGEL